MIYSLTETGSHLIHPQGPNIPRLRVECSCQRRVIQEEIYTCLACCGYCCGYCTQPDIISLDCRSCKASYEQVNRVSRCMNCYECPYCTVPLIISRDPADKNFILLCQFCYWSSKEIKVKAEKAQDLLIKMQELSVGMKQSDVDIYQNSLTYFKDSTAVVEKINDGTDRFFSGKRIHTKSIADQQKGYLAQLKTIQDKLEKAPKTSLNDIPTDFIRDDKVPKQITLIAKKTRRCPFCQKPLNNTYRMRANEIKVDFLYRELKYILCQLKPAVNGRAKLKTLKNLMINGQMKKAGDVVEVDCWQYFSVVYQHENKTKNTLLNLCYKFIIQDPLITDRHELRPLEMPKLQLMQQLGVPPTLTSKESKDESETVSGIEVSKRSIDSNEEDTKRQIDA